MLEAAAHLAEGGDAGEHVLQTAGVVPDAADVGDEGRARVEAGRRAGAARRVLEDPVLAAGRVAAGDAAVAGAHVGRDDRDVEVGHTLGRGLQRDRKRRKAAHQIRLRQPHRRRVVDQEQHIEVVGRRSRAGRSTLAARVPPRRRCPRFRRPRRHRVPAPPPLPPVPALPPRRPRFPGPAAPPVPTLPAPPPALPPAPPALPPLPVLPAAPSRPRSRRCPRFRRAAALPRAAAASRAAAGARAPRRAARALRRYPRFPPRRHRAPASRPAATRSADTGPALARRSASGARRDADGGHDDRPAAPA